MLDQVLGSAEQCPEIGPTFEYHGKGKRHAPGNNQNDKNFGNDVELVFEYVTKNAAAEENHAEFHQAKSEQLKAQKYVFDLLRPMFKSIRHESK